MLGTCRIIGPDLTWTDADAAERAAKRPKEWWSAISIPPFSLWLSE
jgi:hypothetical protein